MSFTTTRLLLFNALLVFAPCSQLQADVITAVALQDNTLFESSTGEFSNGEGVGIFVGRTNQVAGLSLRRGLIQFDLSQIPTGSTINSATLRLTQNRLPGQAGATAISVHRVTSSWGEGTSIAANPGGTGAPTTPNSATWIHRFSPGTNWNTVGGDFVALASATNNAVAGNGNYTWSSPGLTADVQQWANNPNANFGWILIGDEQTQRNARRFASSEAALEQIPQLFIDFVAVPEPTFSGLILLALGAVCSKRRRTTLS